MRESAAELSVIVVNFQSWPDVQRLAADLSSGPEMARGLCELVVADNDSRVLGPPDGLDTPPWFTLIRRPNNDGFAAAVNDAVAVSTGRWLLLMNPDVESGPGFLSRVLSRVRELDRTPGGPPAVVGFGLRNSDGSPQPSVGAFPSLAWCVREALSRRDRRKYLATRKSRPGPVPWVTGACMLIRADVMRDLGGMDPDFFLYHEEVAFCRRVWDAGGRVEFDPSVQVVHKHPLQNRRVAPRMRVITRHSKLLYFRKFLPRWQFEGLAAIVATEGLLRGWWAAWKQKPDERGAWREVKRLPGQLRRRIELKGTAVRELADRATSGAGRDR